MKFFLNLIWYMKETRKRKWSYTNKGIWGVYLSIILTKWKGIHNFTIWSCLIKQKRVEDFLFNGLLSSTWNKHYISLLLEGIQPSLLPFILNNSYWRELQEVIKSRLIVMPMGFFCLVTWSSGALTGNGVYFGLNSNPWNLKKALEFHLQMWK